VLIPVILSILCCQSIGTASLDEDGYTLSRDIVYGTEGDVDLLLDIARPAFGEGPFPALIFLHSGWYAFGSKADFHTEMIEAAKRGYVATVINYRLTKEKVNGKPKYQFPEQIYDGKCAVRWLRENAKNYRVDKNRIGVLGYSSGGHLALMLGLTDSSDGLEGKCGDSTTSSRVQAVVNLSGITDLVETHSIQSLSFYMEAFLGGNPQQIPETYRTGSPLTYVTPDDPPVLSICGRYDDLLPQQEILDDRMRTTGISHTLVIVEDQGHSQSIFNSLQDEPVWNFFDEYLKETK
jgi:acetyl esterase/lipase